MKIEILGSGCRKCNKLYDNVLTALQQTGVDAEVVKVEEFKKIAQYGVLKTPALVIDGKVVVKGRVPNVNEIAALLQ